MYSRRSKYSKRINNNKRSKYSNKRKRKIKRQKTKKIYKGGEKTAQEVLSQIPIYNPPTVYDMNKKTVSELMIWIQFMNTERGLDKGLYNNNKTIRGSNTLSSRYIDRYKSISDIWGYNSTPYINYERLTHCDYTGTGTSKGTVTVIHSLRLFQYISDPLMRNITILSKGEELLPYDTIEFLRSMFSTIDFLIEHDKEEYIVWYCTIVLPHFLRQSNISTLLYELADQRWRQVGPSNDDEQVLMFLSLVSRIFLLTVRMEWIKVKELLEFVLQ